MKKVTTEPLPELLRVNEAAEHLSVSRSKIYTLMDSGELRYVKLGKSRRIPLAELVSLIERNTIANDDRFDRD